MGLGFAQRTDGNALIQLVSPGLRQIGGGDAGALDLVRQFKAEQVGGHALIDGDLTVAVAHIVAGLAPRIHAPAGAGQCRHHRYAADDDRDSGTAFLDRIGFALFDLLVADGFGYFGVVGIGGQASVGLLHHRNLAGVGIGALAGLLADRGGLHHSCGGRLHRGGRHVAAVGACRLHERRRALGGGIILAQRGGRGHGLVDDIGDRLQIAACRSADQRGLVRQVRRRRRRGPVWRRRSPP